MASSPSLLRTRRGSGSRVVLVHGFTQTGASFDRLAGSLAASYEVCTVDLPGHGRSSDVVAASLEQTADLLATSTGQATYLGYSLGGRICLTLALERPELVERLVLVGASPGIDDPAERRARQTADEVLAASLETRAADGEDVEGFLAQWLAGPLFAHLSDEQADVGSRRENSLVGLAASLRSTGAGTQHPARARLGGLDMPVLLVAGASDEKFTTLAREMAGAIGSNAEVAIIADAGHAACFERPEAFLALVSNFLESSSGST